jgi:hypothetical protein
VIGAIHLDDESHVGAEEVEDVRAKLMLAPELDTCRVTVAEEVPEAPFGIRRPRAQAPRQTEFVHGSPVVAIARETPSPYPSRAPG